jgi:alpha-1,2-mannosyltransferase
VSRAGERGSPARSAGLRRALAQLGPPALLGVFPLAVLVLAAASTVHKSNLGVDFRQEFYPEAKLVLHGHNPFPAPNGDLSGGVNQIFPVPVALLVAPLTVLPVGVAAAVFVVGLLAALAGTLWLMEVRDWRVYGAIALWPSTIAALQTGNLTILLGFLVALAWRLRDRRLSPGVAIGAAIALKLFLWPLVVWLLAIRRFAAAGAAAALAVAGTLLVLPFVSLGDYAHLLTRLGNTFGRQSYNLVGLLQQSGIAGLSVAHLVADAVGLVVLALAYRARSLTLAIAAALVLSPIVWLHYFVLLAIPLAIYSRRFTPLWLLPLVQWTSPGNGGDVRVQHIVIGLVLVAVVTALAERPLVLARA